MSLWSKVKGGLDVAQLCIEGFELVEQLLKHGSEPSSHADTLKLIGNVIERVKQALDGKLTPDSVRGEFTATAAALRTNNEVVASRIDELFPK